MGTRSGYLVVAGVEPAELLVRLGMRLGDVVVEPDTDAPDRTPALGPQVAGWTVIVDQPLVLVWDEALLARLSQGGRLLTFTLIDTVMFADATSYVDGTRQWRVASVPDRRDWRRAWPRPRASWWRQLWPEPPGPSKLEADGEPPPILGELLADAIRQESAEPGVDYQIEIPSTLVELATGGAFAGELDEEWEFRALISSDADLLGRTGTDAQIDA